MKEYQSSDHDWQDVTYQERSREKAQVSWPGDHTIPSRESKQTTEKPGSYHFLTWTWASSVSWN